MNHNRSKTNSNYSMENCGIWVCLKMILIRHPIYIPILSIYGMFKRGKIWHGPSSLGYPLVNVYITLERSTMLKGKSTISMAIFNSKLLSYQRVRQWDHGRHEKNLPFFEPGGTSWWKLDHPISMVENSNKTNAKQKPSTSYHHVRISPLYIMLDGSRCRKLWQPPKR